MAVPLVAEPSPVTRREPLPSMVRGIMRAAGSARPAPGMSTSFLAIDGYGGAGKSTLAAFLVEELRVRGLRVDLVHTDDFASADHPLDWWPRMIEQVLEPLGVGTTARYQRYDWDEQELAEWHTVEPGALVILEGVSSSRNAFRPWLSLAVWVETPGDERLRRGLERDGEQALDQWHRWMAEEVAWGEAERPWERADVVVPGVGSPSGND